MASIRERNGIYTITVLAGYRNGKQIRKYKKWSPEPSMTKRQIEKEVENVAYKFEKSIKTGTYYDERITFSEFKKKWEKEYAATELKDTTRRSYLDILGLIENDFGEMKMIEIQPFHIIDYINKRSEVGDRRDNKCFTSLDLWPLIQETYKTRVIFAEKANIARNTLRTALHGKNINHSTAISICETLGIKFDDYFKMVNNSNQKLSGSTLLYDFRVLSSFFSAAVYWQIIPNNPCNRVKSPRKSQKRRGFLDDGQVQSLIEHLANVTPQRRTIVLLLLYSGIRRGELCGLKWCDIDFSKNTLSIERSLLYTPDKGNFISTTKTGGSERVISIPQNMMNELTKHRQWQNNEKMKLGDLWIESDFVFASNNGGFLRPDSLSQWFVKFIKTTNLPYITLHSLRHTNATIQLMHGVPVNTVAGRLGHDKASTTINIYGHAIESMNEKAGNIIGSVLDKKKKDRGHER